MNEYDSAEARKNKIGFAGQCFGMKTITEAFNKQEFAYQKFRPGVFVPDTGHHAAADVWADYINHGFLSAPFLYSCLP